MLLTELEMRLRELLEEGVKQCDGYHNAGELLAMLVWGVASEEEMEAFKEEMDYLEDSKLAFDALMKETPGEEEAEPPRPKPRWNDAIPPFYVYDENDEQRAGPFDLLDQATDYAAANRITGSIVNGYGNSIYGLDTDGEDGDEWDS